MDDFNPIGNLIDGAFGVIDKFVGDKDLAIKIKAELQSEAMTIEREELNAQKDVIVAEAQSESFLTSNWRPITMLTFVALITAHWLGFTAENVGEAEVIALLGIVKVGLGGYVVGRSAERVAKEIGGRK